jgi:hypothetical protein
VQLAHHVDLVATAARTFRNGSSPVFKSVSVIDWPPLAAKGSNGQIFIAA